MSIESRVVPGHLGDDDAFAPDERIQERRLADVRPAEDRDPDGLLPDGPLAVTRQAAHDLVEEVARAVAVERRDRNRVAEAETVELQGLEIAAWVVELVREDEHGPPRHAQDLGELLVSRRHTGFRIDDEEDEVGFLDRLTRLRSRSAGRTARRRRDRRRPCR